MDSLFIRSLKYMNVVSDPIDLIDMIFALDLENEVVLESPISHHIQTQQISEIDVDFLEIQQIQQNYTNGDKIRCEKLSRSKSINQRRKIYNDKYEAATLLARNLRENKMQQILYNKALIERNLSMSYEENIKIKRTETNKILQKSYAPRIGINILQGQISRSIDCLKPSLNILTSCNKRGRTIKQKINSTSSIHDPQQFSKEKIQPITEKTKPHKIQIYNYEILQNSKKLNNKNSLQAINNDHSNVFTKQTIQMIKLKNFVQSQGVLIIFQSKILSQKFTDSFEHDQETNFQIQNSERLEQTQDVTINNQLKCSQSVYYDNLEVQKNQKNLYFDESLKPSRNTYFCKIHRSSKPLKTSQINL